MKTKVTKDGFVWLIVDKDTATAIYKTGTQELYSLYDDDAEGLIESDEDFERDYGAVAHLELKLATLKTCSQPVRNVVIRFSSLLLLDICGGVINVMKIIQVMKYEI